jgi:hypothetical protein
MKDLFDNYAFEKSPHFWFLSYMYHCTQPSLNRALWAMPSDLFIKSFEEQVGPRYEYYEGNGFHWHGLTAFELVRQEDGTTYVWSHAGGAARQCVARVLDAEEKLKEFLGEGYEESKS